MNTTQNIQRKNNMLYAKVMGTGSYLPKKIITNDDLSKMVDTSDEWIVTRTGIKQRHIADENEFTSDLATKAALDAMKSANISADEIDLIILSTTTPNNTFPATATKVQANIQAVNSAAFDIQSVCSGFMYAMTTANNYIKSGTVKTVLVIGAETLSRVVNWKDRNTCVLFGDGAGAVVLQASNSSGILNTNIKSDGSFYEYLKTTSGPSQGNKESFITMNGQEVFKVAVKKMPEILLNTIQDIGLSISDVSWVIPHQANTRIIDLVAKNINIDKEKVIITIDKHANTSAASIPLAFDDAVKSGKIKSGDIIAMTAIGAGFSWGSIVLKY